MEMVLMVVTVVALALAIGMSVLAWRLLGDGRRRSAARVETLQSLAAETEEPESGTRHLALGTGKLRVPSAERLVPDHRYATLDDESGRDTWDEHPTDGIRGPDVMFGATAAVERGAPNRRWLALAAVAVAMAAVVAAVYASYRPASAAESAAPGMTASARAAGPRPLELLSLRHAADQDGTFTVTGLVQNPYDGQTFRKVMAVVYLFDRDGNYFAGGKASLDFTALQPGEESPFVVHVPNVGRVSRYRVGFRSEEGGVVAHVDRRGQLPGGTTGDAIEAPGGLRPSATPLSGPARSEGRP